MRTEPRLSGRRLQTEAVNAGKACKGSPNRSSESGWMWYSRFGVARAGSERAKAPSCEGAMVNGPRRNRRYSRPIQPRASRLAARSLSVRVPWTL